MVEDCDKRKALNMIGIPYVYSKCVNCLPVLSKTDKCSKPSSEDLNLLDDNFFQLGIHDALQGTVILEIKSQLNYSVVPNFWQALEKVNKIVTHDDAAKLPERGNIQLHYTFLKNFLDAIKKFSTDCQNLKETFGHAQFFRPGIDKYQFNVIVRSSLLSQMPANWVKIVDILYNVSFNIFVNKYNGAQKEADDNVTEFPDIICKVCESEVNVCQCDELINIFNEINALLKSMELLDCIAGRSITTLMKKIISTHVRDSSQGIFNRSHVTGLKKWLVDIVFNWLTRIYNNGSVEIQEGDTRTLRIRQEFTVKLTYFLYETYSSILIEQFFNIIIDFPDSTPAIDDLKMCLEMIDLRKHLINSLKKSLEARILHAGVNTMDILTGYVAAIKAIRYLDSSGIVLEAVMNPIKEYLRNRFDTVRKVVTGLTEDGPTDLADELAKGEAFKNRTPSHGYEMISNWENWQPDPIDTCIKNPSTTTQNRSADIISMVVNIYGSKDLFVNEYRNLLADRLLTQLDFVYEKEIRNMELLKLRFGEALLHSCEVMLKDISDSKRINSHIQSDINFKNDKLFDISSLIISSQFWPAFNKETLELPKEIADQFEMYTKSYEAYKGNRTLNWRYVTGRVDIEIEFSDRTLEMTVSPTQAVILYHFQYKPKWALDDLSNLIKVPPSVLRRKIGFWQTHGIIRELETDIYQIVESTDSRNGGSHKLQISEMGEDENETAMASASDQRQEELQVFWSYIVGMLTNLDSLSIERIHQMLKIFASHGPGIELSREELKHFLQTKVREHKLIFSGGVYQLPK